ncbi:MAG: hypothetical protein G3H99_06815 [Ferrovum sp.]|nr:hypothetical protein [Ferrovum sp.]NDU87788.1 hypothetical protein [Ferrovum sp.]
MWTLMAGLGVRSWGHERGKRQNQRDTDMPSTAPGLHILPSTGSVTELSPWITAMQAWTERRQWVYLIAPPYEIRTLFGLFPRLSDSRVVIVPAHSREGKYWAVRQALNHPHGAAVFLWGDQLDERDQANFAELALNSNCFCGQFLRDSHTEVSMPRHRSMAPGAGMRA